MTGFDELWSRVEPIDGWLRREQARRLWAAAGRVAPGGQIVEIGSFHGKSTIALAAGARKEVVFYAIDAHGGDNRGPREWTGPSEQGQADFEIFHANLVAFEIADRVIHVRELSQEAQSAVDGEIDLLYVDGAHGYGPACSDIVEWGERVRLGGTMMIHDVFGSAFVTLAVARNLFWSPLWRYVGRERTLAIYRREHRTTRQQLRSLAAQLACLPWFARNLMIKALERVGLAPLTRSLGHTPRSGVH